MRVTPYPVTLALLSLAMLLGCTPELPDCVNRGIAEPGKNVEASKGNLRTSSEVLIGIDGSGSMLGHSTAADATSWRNLLQAVNLSARTQGLSPRVFRIGAGSAQDLGADRVTQATDPCFFKGCGGYPAVASSLQTLWDVQPAEGATPLRLLVSDLEVNQSDISSLIGAIRKDLAKGASAGVLALKLPFEGQVFDAQGVNIHTGKLNRPLYLLATGKPEQVRSLLSEIQKTMAQKGTTTKEISFLGGKSGPQPLMVKSAAATPTSKGASGIPVRLENITYSPSNNTDYGFVRLNPGATGLVMATITPWTGGTSRPDLGLVRLERIPLTPSGSTDPGGIRLRSMSVAGTNVRLELEITSSAPSGLLRATIPRGSLPDQWWLEWDRTDPKRSGAKEQTEGLLLLMTTLGQQIAADTPSAPAAALCVAYQHS
ncbi:hypothetical protein FQK07_03215 [Synechococcus sp. BSF8S]|uniref:hypothetical protein n=2 Tax=Cyanophyceae TaxID=3028117 RepID=UPI001627627F|nr:hypothetical protein [Synechococcus sp. BSA11S]MBC1260286.1 hypothetical protein [Synechococcus sp. BSF8S]